MGMFSRKAPEDMLQPELLWLDIHKPEFHFGEYEIRHSVLDFKSNDYGINKVRILGYLAGYRLVSSNQDRQISAWSDVTVTIDALRDFAPIKSDPNSYVFGSLYVKADYSLFGDIVINMPFHVLRDVCQEIRIGKPNKIAIASKQLIDPSSLTRMEAEGVKAFTVVEFSMGYVIDA